MQVVLLRKAFGAFPGRIGDTISVPDATGEKLIAGGFAKPAKPPTPIGSFQTTSLPQNNETTSKA